MLQQLQITNFALIERLSIEFGPGLNILTGETGAGKSVVIDALSAVLGERVGSEMIRSGCERALVEAAFEVSASEEVKRTLAELGFEDDDGLLLLSREIGGRGGCRINGRMATVSLLKQIGQSLVDIHGQHEHQSLLSVDRHIELLDRWTGEELLGLRRQMAEQYRALKSLRTELSRLQTDARERARMLDLYRFQVAEIESAGLRAGEEEELMTDRSRLANAEKLHAATSCALDLLRDGESPALDRLGEVVRQLEGLAAIDEELAPALEAANSLLYATEELARDLRVYQEKIEFNPHRLEQVEERLDVLRNLKKKYGATVEEILAYRDEAAQRVEELSHSEERGEELAGQIEALEAECRRIAARLTELRTRSAKRFEKAVVSDLADLAMEKTRFSVAIEPAELSETGADRVEFLISPNPGEPLKPLARIASGGEMSRIMLALKTLLARVDGVPTLVFDEIDAGIGGRTAIVVGTKLAKVAESSQVLCVTHLPQIAGRADRHFSIEKAAQGERTVITVTPLEGEDRVREIARMLGATGDAGAAVDHARELLGGKVGS